MSFFDFVKNLQSQRALENKPGVGALVAQKAVESEAVVKTLEAMAGDEAEKRENFKEMASNVVEDDSFMSELSDQIGEPGVDETEEQFVDRAKREMTNMLMVKLKVK